MTSTKLVNGVPVQMTPEEEAAFETSRTLTPEGAAAQVQAATIVAIQNLLDTTAKSHGYDDLRSTVSYIGSSVPKWNNEGLRARAWRDECWVKAQQIQDAVKAGTRTLPTVAEVLAEMPAADWPTA